MKLRAFSYLALALAFPLLTGIACADSIDIGTAAPFGVLGEAGVTNTGPSVVSGSVAGSTGTPAVTGFPPGSVVLPGVLYTTGVANSGPGTPFGDALAAYNYAAGLSGMNEGTASLGAGGVGGTLATALNTGIYSFTSATVLLNGTLFLNAGADNNASWIFQIPTALTTASASSVEVVDTGSGPFTGSITWDVGSSATLGSTTSFLGTIISKAGDSLDSAATIGCGRVISLDASVTLIDNSITTPGATGGCAQSTGSGPGGSGGTIGGGGGTIKTPEPGELAMLAFGLAALAFLGLRKSRARSAIC
jgi:Ice-binding-like